MFPLPEHLGHARLPLPPQPAVHAIIAGGETLWFGTSPDP
jgi:hypothetical protein